MLIAIEPSSLEADISVIEGVVAKAKDHLRELSSKEEVVGYLSVAMERAFSETMVAYLCPVPKGMDEEHDEEHRQASLRSAALALLVMCSHKPLSEGGELAALVDGICAEVDAKLAERVENLRKVVERVGSGKGVDSVVDALLEMMAEIDGVSGKGTTIRIMQRGQA